MDDLSASFVQVTQIIENARARAYQKVNEELILMYWNVGKFLSEQSENANYGDGYMESLAEWIQDRFPGIKGFNRRGLYRMKQFYELYAGNEKVSTVLTQLSWSNHLCMRDFILELGKDFTFVGEEYAIQVGNEDYRIDLLFFHRTLRCLVAIELKVGKFLPEYVSKMDFYLEGLDRQVKKKEENPSVGLILCASRDEEVVEYAMSRTLSPMMVAEYRLQLPDKAILRKKLQELSSLPLPEDGEDR